MLHAESCRHKHVYPCTCMMGHLYRFVEPVVLLLLKVKGCSHGYDLLNDLSEYAFTDALIERAVLYRTLRRLEVGGYVSSEWETYRGGPARRIYALTLRGDQHLREWAQVLTRITSSMDRFIHAVKSLPLPAGQSPGTTEMRAQNSAEACLAKGESDE